MTRCGSLVKPDPPRCTRQPSSPVPQPGVIRLRPVRLASVVRQPRFGNDWWQRGVIYQVYPRSFADSNGDGNGDLKGVRERLDYLEWLGVDAVWLSPVFRSPMADFGYDVADYEDVDPMFGTLADLDKLIKD